MNKFFVYLIIIILDFLIVIIPLFLMIAFLTLLERKVMGSIQRRRGPNVVGFFGLLQPIADGLKLLLKGFVVPSNSNKILFMIGPIFSFVLSLFIWSIIPFSNSTDTYNIYKLFIFDIDLGILLLFGVSSLNVYGIILSGWASNSRYAFLGSLRASAQMISYEVSFALSILPVIILSGGSLNLREIVVMQQLHGWNLFLIFPSAIIFFISILAETNRTPFDLPEAEGELVAGFNVEYSSIFFALFFLAEYANIILMSTIFVILFLGGWGISTSIFVSSLVFSIKLCCVLFLFIWLRAILPRYRYDQLIQLGWKVFLPFTMGYFLFVSGTVLFIIKLCF